jgi:hypothetical protein
MPWLNLGVDSQDMPAVVLGMAWPLGMLRCHFSRVARRRSVLWECNWAHACCLFD